MHVELLRRLKRESGFYSVEVAAEEGPAAGGGPRVWLLRLVAAC